MMSKKKPNRTKLLFRPRKKFLLSLLAFCYKILKYQSIHQCITKGHISVCLNYFLCLSSYKNKRNVGKWTSYYIQISTMSSPSCSSTSELLLNQRSQVSVYHFNSIFYLDIVEKKARIRHNQGLLIKQNKISDEDSQYIETFIQNEKRLQIMMMNGDV